jgi:hypothetical protein
LRSHPFPLIRLQPIIVPFYLFIRPFVWLADEELYWSPSTGLRTNGMILMSWMISVHAEVLEAFPAFLQTLLVELALSSSKPGGPALARVGHEKPHTTHSRKAKG